MLTKTEREYPQEGLFAFGITRPSYIHYQLLPNKLVQQSVDRGEGVLNNTGALVITTGKFTGRSPGDKYTVEDELTRDLVDWNNFNIPISEENFFGIKEKMLKYLEGKELWVRDCLACAEEEYRLRLRVINEDPASNLFCYNMFIRPGEDDLENFLPHWHLIQAPGFKAMPGNNGIKNENFAILSFKHKTILIGGTGYTGEMKKGIFTMLNLVLPHRANVLSMHCSANVGRNGDCALFFGLSGTGKTTLSADPERFLIGDDEHGWGEKNVFNFEGGCYAKLVDLTEEKEPAIFNAIRPGALVENTRFKEGSNEIDFSNKTITENTRVSYPLAFISNSLSPAIGNIPKNIFFLSADAYGILPPISKLSPQQAMYFFISGYTARVAGTEEGVLEPKSTFSACFGAPFLPLHPGVYAAMMGEKLRKHNVNIWMINTGWSGGGYGVGERISLKYTRAMIAAALEGKLEGTDFYPHDVFKVQVPVDLPGVPSAILNPRNTWQDGEAYDRKAKALAIEFINNFKKYESGVDVEILNAAPAIDKN